MNCTQLLKRKTHSIILYTWCSFSLSYKKIALSIKIQHPATTLEAGPSVKTKMEIITFKDKEITNAPWFVIIQIQAFKSEKTKKAKMFI